MPLVLGGRRTLAYVAIQKRALRPLFVSTIQMLTTQRKLSVHDELVRPSILRARLQGLHASTRERLRLRKTTFS